MNDIDETVCRAVNLAVNLEVDLLLWAEMAMAQCCDGLIALGKYGKIISDRFDEKAIISFARRAPCRLRCP